MKLHLLSLALTLALTAATLAVPAAAADRDITIRFAGKVGDQPFACGSRYPGIGTTGSTITPSDFRFYVSDVALVKADGAEVPLNLKQDGRWQYKNVALIDFEDRSGPCTSGTAETNATVTGTAPDGTYTGIAFTLGVPFDLNHADASLAPSPLNLSGMFWSWLGGYKFLRADMDTSGGAQGSGPGGRGFVVHLGSTACTPRQETAGSMPAAHGQNAHGQGGMKPAESCANPNRPRVVLTGMDPLKVSIVADLGRLLSASNVDVNQPDSALGCMSAPNDADCPAILGALGLGGPQRFFRAE